jgi:filamentous hemagglutinin family protein
MRRQNLHPSPRKAHAEAFRPATLALAIAVAFCGSEQLALANPGGAQAIAGQASLAASGKNLVVTTQNAAGSNFSAINWQSFNIPAGSSTRFVQPAASSTSINRVVTNNPSAIFGTLSSNGNLVLVNPSGITVGTGAVVDTAGFAASTLPMSNSDALAGRQRFAADAAKASGIMQVQGNIIARNGDVVLIAPNVEVAQTAVVQAPNGAAILAAGQSVDVTGRGLEGIRLAVQAPTDSAVNLGSLQGDAVGIFASSLKHSGLIQATAVSTEGGRVILHGQDLVEVNGATRAERLDRLGGLFQATADKVGLSGTASVDVSGTNGGGQILIGGDYQGKNSAIPNAQMTFVGAGAQLNASATEQGDGGKVIVWSDRSTRVFGDIQARGGSGGGNGGLVETSSKVGLEYAAKVDVGASNGKGGTLLLDPESITIVGGSRSPIVTVSTAHSPPGCSIGCTIIFNSTSTPDAAPPATISFANAGPTQVFQSDLEGYQAGTNVVLEATSWIGVAGTFSGSSVTLTPDSSLAMRTRNGGSDNSFTSGIKLSDSNLGANLEFRTQGTGNITLQTGFTGSGAQNANISVGKLTTAGGAISLTAQGSGSDVIVLGNLDAGTGANTLKADGNVRFDGSNPMTLTGSSLSVSGGSGVLVNTSLTNHSGLWVNPAGSLLSINGSLTMGSGSSLNNAGTLDTATHSVVDTANQNLVNQRSGTLKGTGTLNVGSGTVINEGTVAPGHSPGMLAITGNFTQTSTGTLNMEVAGPGNHDLVQVSGTATLGGSLAMQSGTYTPTTTESYNLVRASALTGTFANITSTGFSPGAVFYSTTQAGFTANAVATTPAPTPTPTPAPSPSAGGTTGTGGTTTTGAGSTTGTDAGSTGSTSTSSTTGTSTASTPASGGSGSSLITDMTAFRNLVAQFPLSNHPGNQVTLLNLGYQPAGSEFIINDGQVCR